MAFHFTAYPASSDVADSLQWRSKISSYQLFLSANAQAEAVLGNQEPGFRGQIRVHTVEGTSGGQAVSVGTISTFCSFRHVQPAAAAHPVLACSVGAPSVIRRWRGSRVLEQSGQDRHPAA